MKYLLVLPLFFLFSCSTSFRAEICNDKSKKLPDEYTGLYQLSLPQKRLDNTYDIETLDILIETDSVRLKVPDFNKLRSLEENSSIDIGPGGEFELGIKICQVNKQIFFQLLQDNGLYQIMRLDFSDRGVGVSPLMTNTKKLKQRSIPHVRFPNMDELDKYSGISNGAAIMINSLGAQVVVDNRNISSAILTDTFVEPTFSYFLKRKEGEFDKSLFTIKF